MTAYRFTMAREPLEALPSGALWLPGRGVLCVSDLHLGKSERLARRGGPLLPPYDGVRTLDRLRADITSTGARCVLSLGDSFDDSFVTLTDPERQALTALTDLCEWIWVEGNHDPVLPVAGQSCATHTLGHLTFRHIPGGTTPEVAGHLHPKAAPPRGAARACFLTDGARLILPAYGAYTGGLPVSDDAFDGLFSGRRLAILTGTRALPMPV